MLRALQTSVFSQAAKRRHNHTAIDLRAALETPAKHLFCFLCMFLLMHADALGGVYPFAPAFLAAALSLAWHPAALCLGCMAGMLRLPLHTSVLIPAIACALTLLGELALSFTRKGSKNGETRCALLSGVSVLLPSLLFAAGAPIESLQAVLASASAAATAPFFRFALDMDKRRRKYLSQEKVGIFLLAAVLIGGLEALYPALAQGASVFILLALSPMGAAAGLICGLGRLLGGASMEVVAQLALSGFAANLKLYRTRRQKSACVAATMVLWQLTSAQDIQTLVAGCAAALIYALMPERIWDRTAALCSDGESMEPDRIAREICEESVRRLSALAEAFEEMSQICGEIEKLPDEQALINEMRNRLCGGCAEYGACWNGEDNHAVHFLCALIGEALERTDAPTGMRVIFSDGEIPPEILRFCRRGRMIPDRLGLLLRDFAERRKSVIKRATDHRNLALQYAQAREILYSAAERQRAPVHLRGERLHQLEAALESVGLSDCDVCALDVKQPEIRLKKDGAWTDEEARRAAQAFLLAFGGGFAPHRRGSALYFAQRPRFAAQMGVSCCAGRAGEACGDSHLLRMLKPNLMAIMLSDGMGSGENAARESAETLRLLWRFLSAEMSGALALETVNQQMLMRSGDDIFATVDLLLLDLSAGTAEFSKLAACRTLILRGGDILRVEGGNLPLGILEGVRPMVKKIRVKAGDVILLASDGVMDACDEAAMNRFLREHAQLEPQALAEETVRAAALRRDLTRRDDMTCICLRIEEADRRAKRRKVPDKVACESTAPA